MIGLYMALIDYKNNILLITSATENNNQNILYLKLTDSNDT